MFDAIQFIILLEKMNTFITIGEKNESLIIPFHKLVLTSHGEWSVLFSYYNWSYVYAQVGR